MKQSIGRTRKWLNFGVITSLLLGQTAAFGQTMAGNDKSLKKTPATTATAKLKPLTAEQQIYHLLDRTTFGIRPNDLARVRELGWQKYLAEQLDPAKIADPVVEQKLKALRTQNQNDEALAKAYYPQQETLIAALKARGFDAKELQGGINGALVGSGNSPAANAKPGESSVDPRAAANGNANDVQKRRREMQGILFEMGYRQPQELVNETQQAKILRAVYSERQLQEVMTDFWFNHFNVYIQKGADKVLTTSYERDVLRPRAFGKFEDLLKATAESPAMLFYLDNWMSASPNAKLPDVRNRADLQKLRDDPAFRQLGGQRLLQMRQQAQARQNAPAPNPQAAQPNPAQNAPRRMPRGINENYAREIMELHTLGVDGGYTQKDVQEVARCFTGWTLRNPRGGAQFVFSPFMHDNGEKLVLGQKIAAGGGVNDGYQVIKILARHPSTAKFISTKLARKFVSDQPPAALIERMTQRYLKTDGDMREVLLAMFNAPEFWAPENYRAKIKTPFEMTVSAARALNVETNGGPSFHRWLAQMGEGLFQAQPPTGYPDTAEHWVNTGALLDRMNFALAISANRINGTRVDLTKLAPPSGVANKKQAIDYYAQLLLRSELSAASRTTIEQSLGDAQGGAMLASLAPNEVAKVVGLLLGSPEFQRQ